MIMKTREYINVITCLILLTVLSSCRFTEPSTGHSGRANIYYIGELETPGNAYAVSTTWEKAYLSSGSGGLRIIDTGTPHFPAEIDSYESYGIVWDTIIHGNYAYLASGEYGLEIVDIESPFGPEKIGHIETTTGFGIAKAGNHIYLADGMGGLCIIDVSVSHSPTEIGRLHVSGQVAYSVTIDWPQIYVGSRHGFSIVNIENPYSPYEVSYVSLTDVYDIHIAADLAFIAFDGGLRIYNISDLRDPVFVNEIVLTAPARSVTVRGEFAYLALGSQGMSIVRINNPLQLYEVAWYRPYNSIINMVALSGRYIFAADEERGLLILEFSPGH